MLTNTEMAGNIIPAIATTNAMTAALCVLQSLHVLRTFLPRIPPPNLTPDLKRQWEQAQKSHPNPPLSHARTTFLVRSVDRLLSSEQLRPPNPHCSVCGVAHARIQIDLSRATLRDLVEGYLKTDLGYTDELAVSTDAGVIFDPDLDDNLDKPLSELGVTKDSSITVTDEEDTDPRVNLILNVRDEAVVEGESPIKLLDKFEVKRKPPKPVEESLEASKPAEMANGNGHLPQSNGVKATGTNDADVQVVTTGKRKRGLDELDLEADIANKRGKVMEERPKSAGANGGDDAVQADGNAADAGALLINDEGDGAIVIDD